MLNPTREEVKAAWATIHAAQDAAAAEKDAFHRDARKIARKLAKRIPELGPFKIFNCKGGSAILGEVYLQGPHLTVCFCKAHDQFFYRWCEKLGDARGRNRWFDWAHLRQVGDTGIDMLAACCRAAVREGQ